MPRRPTAAALLTAASLLASCAEAPPPPPPTPATSPAAPLGPNAPTGGGHVVVDCVIGTDGVVRGCRVVTSEGGSHFVDAVLDWLTGPHAARYRPALRGGVAVPEAHRWDIYFSPP